MERDLFELPKNESDVNDTDSAADERGFTPSYDLDPEDVFEQSSFYDE